MIITVDVLKKENIRQPDYEGSYTVIEDNGETMVIKTSEELDLTEIDGRVNTNAQEISERANKKQAQAMQETLDMLVFDSLGGF